MKKGLIALITLFSMTTGLPAVQADDRRYRYSDGPANWRLGERVRDGFAIYRNGYRIPGSATALADGWALGSARESGGFAIFRWNGRHWDGSRWRCRVRRHLPTPLGNQQSRPALRLERVRLGSGFCPPPNRPQGFNSRRFDQRSGNPFRSWGVSEGGHNFGSDTIRRHADGRTHRRQRGNRHYRSW